MRRYRSLQPVGGTDDSSDPSISRLQSRSIDNDFLLAGGADQSGDKSGGELLLYSFIHLGDLGSQRWRQCPGRSVSIEWQVSEFTNSLLWMAGIRKKVELRYHPNNFGTTRPSPNWASSVIDAAAVQSALQDNQDSSSYYIKFEINNRPSANIAPPPVIFPRRAEIGFEPISSTSTTWTHDADWKVMEKMEPGSGRSFTSTTNKALGWTS